MKTWREIFLTATAVVAMAAAAPAIAQNATVHGKVNNPAGQPLADAQVKFTKDTNAPAKDRKYISSFPTDAEGNYKATGIAPGDYLVVVSQGTVDADYQKLNVKQTDTDLTLNFDMTRPEYINGMTPEARKALEEYKKNNAAAAENNKKISNLNATLASVRADLKAAQPTAGDVGKDVADMKSAVDAKPDESILWISYGDALQAQGDHFAKPDKDAHKPVSGDDEAMKNYNDAIEAYKKGADLNAASKKPVPADQAAAWNGVGNVYAKEGKPADAASGFENAVKAEPTNAGMFYGNEAAVLFNAGQTDAAAAAADKAIAADPNRADPYFIKGQALIAKATVDPKTQKIVAPPGCVEAYQKFLQLAPDSPRAASVKEILTSMGEKIDTRYSARKK